MPGSDCFQLVFAGAVALAEAKVLVEAVALAEAEVLVEGAVEFGGRTDAGVGFQYGRGYRRSR